MIIMRKILVVEDDIFLRKVISRKLFKSGYLPVEAADGEKGFEDLKKEKPDLVLLDLVLPEMTGFEFLAKIKKDASFSKIPVIILSNLGDKKSIDRGKEMGAVDYLIKAHFTPGEIIDKIKTILGSEK